MADDDTSILAKQGSISFIGRIFQKGVSFLFLAVATRLVSPSTYGVFSLALTFVIFLQGFGTLNIHRALDYFVPQFEDASEPEKIRQVLFQVSLTSLVGTMLVGTAVVLAAPTLANLFDEPRLVRALPALAIALPLLGLSDITGSLFKGLKRVDLDIYTRRILRPVVKLITTLILAYIGFRFAALVGGYIVALVAVLVASAVFFARTEVSATGSRAGVSLREVISYAAPLAFAGVIYTIVWQIDYFVLGYFGTTADVAIYRVSYQLASNLIIVLGSLNPIYKPLVAGGSNEPTRLESLYRLTTRWGVLFTLPLAVTLALAPTAYLEVLFTPKYAVAGLTVTVLAAGYFANALGGSEGMMLEGLGHTRLSLINAVVLIIINFALDVALVPRFGVLGAAIGTATALSVRVFAGVFEIRHLYGITPYTATLAQVLLAGLPALFVGSIVTTLLSNHLFLIVSVPIGVTVPYAATLYVLSPFTRDDKLVAERIDDRLGRRIVTRALPALNQD